LNKIDQIIKHATSLKSHTTQVRGVFDSKLKEKEDSLRKVHSEREALENQISQVSSQNHQERARLEKLLSEKDAEQAKKLAEYDTNIHNELKERERVEREREELRGAAGVERKKIANLLLDLEQDASSYSRLRPSKPILNEDDVAILRALFLSSAGSGDGTNPGKLSFHDLQAIIKKYEIAAPEGNLKKLYQLVENDKQGRMSYITLVAVTNDLVALIADFRTIDKNGNGSLSRKEFRDRFMTLGFKTKNSLDALFRFADEDESDEVTFQEYVHLSVTLLVLRILFSAADYDKSGTLSKQEILKILSEAAVPSSALQKFDHFYSVVDKDDSKSLDFQEFVMLVLNMFVD